MAKGITQEQVTQVADTLLLAGERPTIERIRVALGTGSPNTVNRFLDHWWAGLGQRLTTAQIKVGLPDAPPEIATLASQWWEYALDAAQVKARAEFDSDRNALVAQRAEMETQSVAINALLTQLQSERDAANQTSDIATLRLNDLLRLVDQQTAQLSTSNEQRDRTSSELCVMQTTLAGMKTELQKQQLAWKEERAALEAAHVTTQNRWMAEVDRARQNEAKSASKLKQLEQLSERSAQKTAEQLSDLNKRLLQAERDGIKSTTKMASLQEENTRLHAQLKSQLLSRPSKAAVHTKKPIHKAK